MRDFTKFPTMIWRSGKLRSLPDDEARLLFCYCLTSPHQTRVGCCHLPAAYIASDLVWTEQKVDQKFADLENHSLLQRDRTTDEVFILSWFELNAAQNDKDAKGIKKVIGQIVSDDLREMVTVAFEASDAERPPDKPKKSDRPFEAPKMGPSRITASEWAPPGRRTG